MKRMQWMLLLALAMPAMAQAGKVAQARSPDGRIVVELDLNGEGRLAYRVSRDGKPVVADSRLGFILVIPKQTGPNLRGFGHEAMPFM